LVDRDGFGEPFDQQAEFLDLQGERVGDGAGAIDRGRDFPLQGGEAVSHLRDLSRQVGFPARHVGKLTARRRWKPDAAGDHLGEHQCRQGSGGHRHGLRHAGTEVEMDAGAGKSRDHHHAQGYGDGTKTH
jgi:hypothetical protein